MIFVQRLFSKLPPPPARRYLPKNLNFSNLDQVKKPFEELIQRPLSTLSSVKQWLNDLRELSVAFEEYTSMAYIRKSVNTRDKKAHANYLHLIQKIHQQNDDKKRTHFRIIF